jgi:hypothetical protein
MYLRDKRSSPVDKQSSPVGKSGALSEMEEKTNGNGNSLSGANGGGHTIEEEVMTQKMRIGDLCPECGEAAVVNEEGCRKCYSCGYSEC